MMIENNHVNAACGERLDCFYGGRAAVHGEKQRRRKFFQAIVHAVGAQAVAFIHPAGQIEFHAPAERAQNFHEQCGAGHAVHVVIAEDDERFVFFPRAEQPPDGGGHVREQKRVGEIFEPRLDKIFNGSRFAEAAIDEALREQRGDFEP